jgi:isopentenyl diphosphate isomerase/L-lactate dehydrogenase-like FMN-dependent dehydrogenase
MSGPDLDDLFSLPDYERRAHERLDARADAYIAGGAADEHTLADNVAAWRRRLIRPRVFTGAVPSTTTRVLGRPRPHPVMIAPTAFATLCHPDGETGLARAAAATDTVYCLATLAGTSPAALAEAVPEADRWFQLYALRDRGLTRDLIGRAREHGYEALVVTADRAVPGVRDRELRHAVRFGVAGATAPDLDRAIGSSAPADFSGMIDPQLRWDDLADFAGLGLPVLVKGILTAEDARLARDHGAAGVVVSNHGGRQLDTVLATADALPEIVAAVGDDLDVLVDGGIRRGTDVLKALALGARAVMIGRPSLWGLAAGGSDGARRVLEILVSELRTAMALTGVADVAALGPQHLAPAPGAGG